MTDRAEKVMTLANAEAQRLHHHYVGTEHILLGILRDSSCVAAKALSKFGIDIASVETEVAKLIKPEASPATGILPRTPRVKRA